MKSSIGIVESYRDKVLNGPVGKTLLWLGLPLMVVQLVNISYNIADTYWLSRYDPVAYAAPRQIWPFFMFLNAIVQGIASANMALISQSVGARDYDYTRKLIANFVSTIIILNTSTTICFLVAGPIVYKYVMTIPPGLYDFVMAYSRIIAFDLLLMGLYTSYSTILQALGDTRTPSRAGIISALLNIALDPFFIFGVNVGEISVIPSMGVTGAALATVLSRLIGFVVVMIILLKRYPFLRVKLTIRIDRDWVFKSVKIGAPVSFMMMSNSLAFMFQNRLINSFGEFVAAAAAIGFVLMDLADATLWGFTSAVATMVGQAIGAGLTKRARDVGIKAMTYIGLSSFVGSMFVLFLRRYFISLFTSVPMIVSEADLFVMIFAPTLAFFAIFFIGMSIGRGSGHTLYPTAVGIIRLWLVRIGIGYALSMIVGLGTLGLWLAMSFSNLASGAMIIPWIFRGNWTTPVVKKHSIIR